MAWVYLGIAGAFEVLWAIALKYTNNFTNFIPSAISVVGMAGSVYFLALSVRTLPLGTAYTVWTGIGATGTVICGMVLLNESRDPIRVICLLFIIFGIVGLKLFSR